MLTTSFEFNKSIRSLFHEVIEVTMKTPHEIAVFFAFSKASSSGGNSVCPVAGRSNGAAAAPPPVVGTGGTTFDYLQQHITEAWSFKTYADDRGCVIIFLNHRNTIGK